MVLTTGVLFFASTQISDRLWSPPSVLPSGLPGALSWG